MKNLEKEFAPYEEALELEGIGFTNNCLAYYHNISKRLIMCEDNDYVMQHMILAPTYSQAFRWFREKHGLDNAVLKDRFVIETEEMLPNWYYGFDTYEEAELACLKKLIEIVKNNKP